MTKLTQAQRDLLDAAAADAAGLAIDDAVDRKVLAALIKRGFCLSVPQAEGPSRILLTEAGRMAFGLAAAADLGFVEDPGPLPAQSASEPSAPLIAAARSQEPRRPKGKLGKVVELLERPGGATVEEMSAATGWQAHSVRGAMSGALKKKLGLSIASQTADGVRRYSIASA